MSQVGRDEGEKRSVEWDYVAPGLYVETLTSAPQNASISGQKVFKEAIELP